MKGTWKEGDLPWDENLELQQRCKDAGHKMMYKTWWLYLYRMDKWHDKRIWLSGNHGWLAGYGEYNTETIYPVLKKEKKNN